MFAELVENEQWQELQGEPFATDVGVLWFDDVRT